MEQIASIEEAEVFSSGTLVFRDPEKVKVWPFGKTEDYFVQFRIVRSEPAGVKGFAEGTGFVIEMRNPPEENFSVKLPMHIADLSGRKILADFALVKAGSTPITWILSYTFLDGGVADVDTSAS